MVWHSHKQLHHSFVHRYMKSLHACRINLPGLCSHVLISETVLVIMVRRGKIWHQILHFKLPIWWSVFGNNALAILIARGYGKVKGCHKLFKPQMQAQAKGKCP